MGSTILVVGATGTVGLAVVRQLAASGASVRGLTRDTAKAGALKLQGVEFMGGDLERPVTLNKVLAGVTQIFVASAADPRMAASQGNLIDAVRRAGVQRIVKVSAMGASKDSPNQLLRWHREVEEQIERSGLSWTHLRPCLFMQNALGFAPSIRSQGAFYGCMKRGRAAFIDARDVATAGVAVLKGSGHDGKVYDLTGPEALSLHEVADRVGAVLRQQVIYVDQGTDKFVAGLLAADVPEWFAKAIAGMYELGAQGKLATVSDNFRSLTGDPPSNFERFVQDYMGQFKGL